MKQHKCDICGREINKQIKSNDIYYARSIIIN